MKNQYNLVIDIVFGPIKTRNYTPIRTFITKWDVELDRKRVKKVSRIKERDNKYEY
jgi:hypothetical protein